MIKRYNKVSDSSDPVVLKNEVLLELRTELKQAQYNSNWKRATFLKKQIEEIEQLKQ